MSSSTDLLRELLDRVRRDFYPGRDDLWHPQKKMIQQALTHPARWLHERRVPMSADRYRQIILLILDTARRHGNLQAVHYRSRYLLHCVQEHMTHHGDEYYQQGKSTRNRLTLDLAHIERTHAARQTATADVIAPFAQVHDALLLTKRRREKATPQPSQKTLF